MTQNQKKREIRARWAFVVLFLNVVSLAGCAPPLRPVEPSARPAPSSFTLAPPGSVSSLTLLPAEPPPAVTECTLSGGEKVRAGSYLSPGLSAALGGELERLAGLPGAYQKAERESAALAIENANREIARQAAELSALDKEKHSAQFRAYQWRRAAPVLFLGGATAGFLLGAFLIGF